MASFTTRDAFRGLVPLGILELLRAKRKFEIVGYPPPQAWWMALSPARELVERSGLAYLPNEILRARTHCVVDVGANVGDWADAALRFLQPQRLIALEPGPQMFQKLEARVGQRPEVQLVNAAAGERRERAKLNVMSSNDFSSLLSLQVDIAEQYGRPLHAVDEMEVDVLPLDEILAGEDAISILKIDVQGAEWAVLAGAEETLRRTSAVILEVNFRSHYEGDRLFCDLHGRLAGDLGFSLLNLARPYHAPDGTLLRADAIYARRPESGGSGAGDGPVARATPASSSWSDQGREE